MKATHLTNSRFHAAIHQVIGLVIRVAPSRPHQACPPERLAHRNEMKAGAKAERNRGVYPATRDFTPLHLAHLLIDKFVFVRLHFVPLRSFVSA